MAELRSALMVVLSLACHVYAAPVRAENVREAVEAGNRAFVAAFLRGDSVAIANLYTENAQVIAPSAPIASGRSAIASFWKGSIESGIKDVTLQTIDVETAGNLAYETGTVRLVAKNGTATEARYVVVWKRIGDQWKLHRDIWNSAAE